MRKHTRRRVVIPQPPPGLRPRLDAGQRLDLGLVHHQNVDAIEKGEGSETLLWQHVEGVLTWSRAADLLAARSPDHAPAVDEMRAQLELATRLVERYGRSGRVLFAGGLEIQLARRGALVMDELAETVTRLEAIAAAEWSERQVEAMVAACARRAA
mgnify:CR=1 FL=1